MGNESLKRDCSDCFCGHSLDEQVVPQDHLLVQSGGILACQRFAHRLVEYCREKANVARAPYDPAVMLNMLLVSHLHDIFKRRTEEIPNLNLEVGYLVG